MLFLSGQWCGVFLCVIPYGRRTLFLFFLVAGPVRGGGVTLTLVVRPLKKTIFICVFPYMKVSSNAEVEDVGHGGGGDQVVGP